MTAQLIQHPLSAAFPAMAALEFADLVDDIRANGLRSPIVIFEGKVLDGWHRYRACTELKIVAASVDLPEGVDPVAYVRSQNYHRRHLSASQKAVAEVELRKWAPVGNPNLQPNPAPGAELAKAAPNPRRGGPAPGAEPPNPAPGAELATVPQMAKAAEVGARTIERAKVAVAAGLGDAVKAGEVSVKRAAEIARLPERERQAAIHAPRPKPEPRPRPAADGEVEKLRKLLADRDAEIATLKGQVEALTEEKHELARLLEATEEENKSLGRVEDAGDKAVAALAEAKRYRELARVTEERNRGLMGQNHALAADAKRWMGKFLRLERKMKDLPALPEDPAPAPPEPEPLALSGFSAPQPLIA